MLLSLEKRKRYCPLEMAMVDEHRCADCKYGYDLPDGTIVCKFFEKKRKSVEVGQCHKCLGTVYMKYGKIRCTGCGAEYEIEGRCPKCGKPLLYDGKEYYLYCSKCSFSCIYIPSTCDKCGNKVSIFSLHYVEGKDGESLFVCDNCFRNIIKRKEEVLK